MTVYELIQELSAYEANDGVIVAVLQRNGKGVVYDSEDIDGVVVNGKAIQITINSHGDEIS